MFIRVNRLAYLRIGAYVDIAAGEGGDLLNHLLIEQSIVVGPSRLDRPPPPPAAPFRDGPRGALHLALCSPRCGRLCDHSHAL